MTAASPQKKQTPKEDTPAILQTFEGNAMRFRALVVLRTPAIIYAVAALCAAVVSAVLLYLLRAKLFGL